MKIIIIRHGEPDYSIDSLTPKGWYEAELLSRRLINMPIHKFYCSPLGRAKDTASPTLEKLGVTAEILPWMREIHAKIQPLPPNGHNYPWDIYPGVWKDIPEVYDREKWVDASFLGADVKANFEEIKQGVDELLAEYGYVRNGNMYKNENNTDKTIVLFCHFALGTAVLAYLTGISPFIMWENFLMPPTGVTTLITSELKKGDVSFRCIQYGDTSHLYFEGEPVSPAGLMPELFNPNCPKNG